MKEKNVLVFSYEYPPLGSGAGVVAKQYCQAFVDMGCNVTLVTRKQPGKIIKINSVNVIEVPNIPKIWFVVYGFFLKKMNLMNQDLIVLNDIGACYVAGLFFTDKALSRSVVFLHGSEPEQIYESSSLLYKMFFFQKVYNRVIKKVRKLVAVSFYMKKKFLKVVEWVDEKKIEVIYSGLDSSFFDGVQNKKIEKKTGKQIILSVSRIEEKKGFPIMYSIFKDLIDVDDDFLWIVVGDGSYFKEFKAIVDSEEMNDKVIFKKKMDRCMLRSYYLQADVFWLLSQYKESFGLVYIEAQVFGCPVIALNRYGVKEAVQNKKTGFLLDKEEESFEILIKRKYKNLSDFSGFVNKFSPTVLKAEIREKLF